MDRFVPDTVKHAVVGKGDAKHDQMRSETVEATDKTRITTDWGTKQSNTDEWLRVNREGQTGPMLLEDGFAREKVCWLRRQGVTAGTIVDHDCRFTDLTTNASPNE